MMMASTLVVLLASAAASSPFDLYENADNGHLRLEAMRLLGSGVASPRACEGLCVATLGAEGCRSFVFYHAGYRNASLAARCYGDASGAWKPFYSDLSAMDDWGNVT